MSRFIPQFEPVVLEACSQAVYDQMQTGWVGTGNTTLEFEKLLAEKCGVKYAISTTSGTSAIILALLSLKIPKDKKIIFPGYTFLAGANAAKFLGYEVVLLDIKEDTLCLNVEYIEMCMHQENIGAVIFVNHNGYVGDDLLKAKEICAKYNIPMIEDSAQCMGIDGAFQTGDISIVSFSVPKLITTGQGGALFTNNDKYAELSKRFRDHGDNWRKTKTHNYLGVNFKFNDILSAYGISQIDKLDKIKETKKKILDNYENEGLDIYRFNQDIVWMCILKNVKNPEKLIDKLKSENIQSVQYYRSIDKNNPYKYSNWGNLKISHKVSKEAIYIPSSLNLTEEEIKKISKIIKEVENE